MADTADDTARRLAEIRTTGWGPWEAGQRGGGRLRDAADCPRGPERRNAMTDYMRGQR